MCEQQESSCDQHRPHVRAARIILRPAQELAVAGCSYQNNKFLAQDKNPTGNTKNSYKQKYLRLRSNNI
jgi:hypothetical protein